MLRRQRRATRSWVSFGLHPDLLLLAKPRPPRSWVEVRALRNSDRLIRTVPRKHFDLLGVSAVTVLGASIGLHVGVGQSAAAPAGLSFAATQDQL